MKKITLSVSLVLLAAVLMISSCSKSSGSSGSGTMSFTANGVNYSYPAPSGMVGSTVAGSINATGTDASNNNLILVVRSLSSGTYAFSYSNSLEWSKNSVIYTSGAGTGSVTLSINGASADATFSTTLYNSTNLSDSIIITNGHYSGKYNQL